MLTFVRPLGCVALLLAYGCSPRPSSPVIAAAPRLERVAVVATRSGVGAEIVSVARELPLAAVANGEVGTVEVFDLAEPDAPRSRALFDLGLAPGETITSVALAPDGAWFVVAVVAPGKLERGALAVHRATDGARLDRVAVGVQPDCVVLSPDGRRALVANEAQDYVRDADGELRSAPGSLDLVTLAADGAVEGVTRIALAGWADLPGATRPEHGRLLEREVDGAAVLVPFEGGRPHELEPEAVAFSPDGTWAYVTLQENDAVVVVDVAAGTVARVVGLGTTRHAADVADDGRVAFVDELVALREPDGVAVTPDGACFVTADEGDTDPKASKTRPGAPAGGGRTLSVFDAATGELLGDTGAQLDRVAHARGLYPDDRSDAKGSEPEMVTVFEFAGRVLAAVGLERADAVALVDLGEPSAPRVLDVVACGVGPQGPEGVAHLEGADGATYVLAANEVSGTLVVFRVVG